MKSQNTLIDEHGTEKLYQLYTEYMSTKSLEKNWHPFVITPANEYYEDDSKTGFVLDVYAGDIIGEYDTFDEAFSFIIQNQQAHRLIGNFV